ncbi:MAG: hypothetical protein Q4E39_04790 [bacterium]|nr:hypothetical protein [bacterium]
MTKKKLFFVSLLFLIICSVENVFAKEQVNLYFFHGDGCPHCAEEEKFLAKIEKKYSYVKIIRYEVWKNKSNALLMDRVGNRYDVATSSVPLTVISGTAISGYSESIGIRIERAIKYYKDNPKENVNYVSQIKNGTFDEDEIKDSFSEADKKTDESTKIKLPLLGKINLKDFSLPTAATLIGLVDGFNPCAMWVLLFLISMLLGMKDRKRMWILGLTFLLSSALVYMAIMLSWFNIVVNVMASVIFRNIISVIAIVGAIINLRAFFKSNDSGCEVVNDKKRKKVISKIKDFTKEKSLFIALGGVIFLAISVNVIELACSAGLPLVFTQLLAINNVSSFESFIYTLIYIFFFLIDDIIIFLIAMSTTKVHAISTKYNKYSHLIGGILMLIIGILLLVKPEWLMFNF